MTSIKHLFNNLFLAICFLSGLDNRIVYVLLVCGVLTECSFSFPLYQTLMYFFLLSYISFLFLHRGLLVPMEKEMATHSSVLAWRIPRTVEPGGLPSMGSHRVGHNWSDLAAAAAAAATADLKTKNPWILFLPETILRGIHQLRFQGKTDPQTQQIMLALSCELTLWAPQVTQW